MAARPEAAPLLGASVHLIPLTLEHVEPLAAALNDADSWTWVAPYAVPGVDGMRELVQVALEQTAAGTRIPYVHLRPADGAVLGTTSYLEIDEANAGVEIGHTVLGPAARRTAVNTEAKLLMLGHAFGAGCERVALRTDHLNLRSQAAIERTGGVREGVLRHHRQRADGSWRDTVSYSILRQEWPAVEARLQQRLRR